MVQWRIFFKHLLLFTVLQIIDIAFLELKKMKCFFLENFSHFLINEKIDRRKIINNKYNKNTKNLNDKIIMQICFLKLIRLIQQNCRQKFY
jgi:hypothetical protein